MGLAKQMIQEKAGKPKLFFQHFYDYFYFAFF